MNHPTQLVRIVQYGIPEGENGFVDVVDDDLIGQLIEEKVQRQSCAAGVRFNVSAAFKFIGFDKKLKELSEFSFTSGVTQK